MGDYAQAAEYYDLLYEGRKDYGAETDYLAALIGAARSGARSVLDVGCGTGSHARCLLDRGFAVDGVDVEPAFVAMARAKCPEGSFVVGDMTTLDLPGRYDVVTCLFSAIGYVRTEPALRGAVLRMRRHLNDGGVVLVDPWFELDRLEHGRVMAVTGERDGLTVCRVSRTVVEGAVSRLEFEYIIGAPDGLHRRSEVHELGLFTQAQMEGAFTAAGLAVRREPEAWGTRGVYVGRLP